MGLVVVTALSVSPRRTLKDTRTVKEGNHMMHRYIRLATIPLSHTTTLVLLSAYP